MTPQFRAATQVVDALARRLLIRLNPARPARRRAASNRKPGAKSLSRQAERWPWRTQIVGLAVCERRTGARRVPGELVVTFFVRRKLARSRLSPHELIPEVLELPDGRRVATDVVPVRGTALAESTERPLRPGCSVGHFQGPSGTLGPIVRKIGGSQRLIMSCSHVMARAGLARPQDAIEQPADDDGGVGPNVVAQLTNDFTRLNPLALNTMDVALAAVTTGIGASNAIVGGTVPSGVSTLEPEDLDNLAGISLTRFGARTGVRPGILEGMHAAMPLEVPALGQPVVFSRVGLYRTHSLEGDSGAPIVRSSTGELFGIHIGRVADFGVFCPIRPLFDHFGLELVP